MKVINKINYEQFAIDYLEGNLSGNLLLEMEGFLNQNPDIKEELEEMELFYLEADESIVFENKDILLKKEKGFFIRPLFWIPGIAALLFLMAGLFLFNINDNFKNTIAHEEEIIIHQTPNDVIHTDNNVDLTNNIKEEIIKKEEVIANKTIKKEPIQKREIIKSKTIIKKSDNNKPTKRNSIRPNDDIPIAYSKPKNPIRSKNNYQPTTITSINKKEDEVKPIAKQEIPIIKNNTPEQKNNIELKPLEFEAIAFNEEEIILENNLTVVEPKEQSRLVRMGLLPENNGRKISLKTIKEALIPEAFASRD